MGSFSFRVFAIKHFTNINGSIDSKRFIDECRSLASLKHENIVEFKEKIETEAGCYLVMEYCEVL